MVDLEQALLRQEHIDAPPTTTFAAPPAKDNEMAPLWHHGTIAPRAAQKDLLIFEKYAKVDLSFEGVLRVEGAGAHAETIGNVYSFAHAKYGTNS